MLHGTLDRAFRTIKCPLPDTHSSLMSPPSHDAPNPTDQYGPLVEDWHNLVLQYYGTVQAISARAAVYDLLQMCVCGGVNYLDMIGISTFGLLIYIQRVLNLSRCPPSLSQTFLDLICPPSPNEGTRRPPLLAWRAFSRPRTASIPPGWGTSSTRIL